MKWWTVKSIFVIPHAASKTFIQLTGHVWLWETPENCFFSVLFVMSRSVSFLTIVCLVADSFIQSRDETYYNKVFRNRDCIPLTGACWILGFAVAISPFSSSRNELNFCDLKFKIPTLDNTHSKMAVSRVSRIDISSRFQFGFKFMESCRIQFSFIHGDYCAYDFNAYTWNCSGLIITATFYE